jgi:hypothetical protein
MWLLVDFKTNEVTAWRINHICNEIQFTCFSCRVPVAGLCRDCTVLQPAVLSKVNKLLCILWLGCCYCAYSDRPLYLFIPYLYKRKVLAVHSLCVCW